MEPAVREVLFCVKLHRGARKKAAQKVLSNSGRGMRRMAIAAVDCGAKAK